MFYILFALLAFYLYRTNTIQTTAKNLYALYTVSRQYNGSRLKAIYGVVFICQQAMKLAIKQYLTNSLERVGKTTFELTYLLGGQMYKIVIRQKQGPRPLLIMATDESDKDITDTIMPYLGPNHDFHMCAITPDYFNTDGITLHYSTGYEKTFSRHDVLSTS